MRGTNDHARNVSLLLTEYGHAMASVLSERSCDMTLDGLVLESDLIHWADRLGVEFSDEMLPEWLSERIAESRS